MTEMASERKTGTSLKMDSSERKCSCNGLTCVHLPCLLRRQPLYSQCGSKHCLTFSEVKLPPIVTASFLSYKEKQEFKFQTAPLIKIYNRSKDVRNNKGKKLIVNSLW